MSQRQSSDVIIIGGGVIGLSSALELARRGASVTVIERGRCGQEASWAAAGILKPISWHRRTPMATLQRESLLRFGDFAADLASTTGIDPQFVRCGSLTLLFNDQQLRMAESETRVATDYTKQFGRLVFEVLSPDEARERESAVNSEILGAALGHVTAQVRTPRLMKALVAAARQAGVHIVEENAVEEIVIERGRAIGVRTSTESISADVVVNAAGAWASGLTSNGAESPDVYPVRGQMVLIRMQPGAFTHVIDRGKTYLTCRDDGHVLLGATEEHEAGFKKQTTAEGIERLLHEGGRLVPAIREAAIERMWAGLRPGTPDDRPFIGFQPGVESMVVATGHYRTGIIMAPITARIVADLIIDGETPFDLSGCNPARTFNASGRD